MRIDSHTAASLAIRRRVAGGPAPAGPAPSVPTTPTPVSGSDPGPASRQDGASLLEKLGAGHRTQGGGREVHRHDRDDHDGGSLRRTIETLDKGAKDLMRTVKRGAKRVLDRLGDDEGARAAVHDLLKDFTRSVRGIVKDARARSDFDYRAVVGELESVFASYASGVRKVLVDRADVSVADGREVHDHEPPARDEDATTVTADAVSVAGSSGRTGGNTHEPPTRNDNAVSVTTDATSVAGTSGLRRDENGHEPPVRTDATSVAGTAGETGHGTPGGAGRLAGDDAGAGTLARDRERLLDGIGREFRSRIDALLEHLASPRLTRRAGHHARAFTVQGDPPHGLLQRFDRFA